MFIIENKTEHLMSIRKSVVPYGIRIIVVYCTIKSNT